MTKKTWQVTALRASATRSDRYPAGLIHLRGEIEDQDRSVEATLTPEQTEKLIESLHHRLSWIKSLGLGQNS